MIEPRPELGVLSEPIGLESPLWIAICRPIVSPIRQLFQWLVRARKEKLILRYIRAANRCSNRTELEQILGEPRCSIVGKLYSQSNLNGSEKMSPDVVEIYVVDGFRFDVWFLDRKIYGIAGYPYISCWD